MAFRLTLALVLCLQIIGSLGAQQMDEYHVKAAFLYNFAKFIDWPAEAFQSPDDPFLVCVLGQDPFGDALDKVVAGKAISGHAFGVRRISDAHRTAGCHILFVSSSEHRHVLSIVAAAKQPGILTVGEATSPASEGVIINFILTDGRVRFEINIAEAEEERLRISSKLLNLATNVKR